jgi:hypothetical protein
VAGTREGKRTHVDVGDAMTGVLNVAHDEFCMDEGLIRETKEAVVMCAAVVEC